MFSGGARIPPRPRPDWAAARRGVVVGAGEGDSDGELSRPAARARETEGASGKGRLGVRTGGFGDLPRSPPGLCVIGSTTTTTAARLRLE